jgi:hypothetical protein
LDGPALLVARGDVLEAWAAHRAGEQARLVSVDVRDGRRVERLTLSGPLAVAPRVAVDGRGDPRVGLLGEDGVLTLVSWSGAEAPRSTVIARGVDRRFAPALHALGATTLIAHTLAAGEGMHVQVTRVHGGEATSHDVTPQGHGASAPAFVLGEEPPTLVMIDARAGVSPLLEVPFDAEGHPKPAIVRTPVSQPYAPSEVWAVHIPALDVEVAYTAIGRAAATAVGRVPLREAKAPLPLLPSRGYGQLHLSAARGERAAVFALESPQQPVAQAELKLEVVLIDAQGEGARLTLDDETLGAPSIVALSTKGRFALMHRDGSGFRVLWLSCDA